MYEVCQDAAGNTGETAVKSVTVKLDDALEIASGGAANFGRRWVVIDTILELVVWESEPVAA